MARRPAEGSLTGVLVFRPELNLPLWYRSHRAIGRAALLPFVVLLLDALEPRPAGGREVLTKHSVISLVRQGSQRALSSPRSGQARPNLTRRPRVSSHSNSSGCQTRCSRRWWRPPPAHPRVRRLPQIRPRLVPIFSSSCSASELQLVRLKPGSDIKACKQEKPCT